jgi:AcrR family transcriptional regulator
LEAAIRCIATNGLAATTLDGIAAEAGMARGHVRHFAGNRDEILTAAAVLLYFGELPEVGASTVDAHSGSFLPAGTADIGEALDYLFGGFAEPGPENVAALAFVDAARTNERIRAVVIDAYLSSETELRSLLAAAAPQAPADEIGRTAYGVLVIALGNVFMSDIQPSPERTAVARGNAELLIDGIGVGVGRS